MNLLADALSQILERYERQRPSNVSMARERPVPPPATRGEDDSLRHEVAKVRADSTA
jgi:hypothetical protein